MPHQIIVGEEIRSTIVYSVSIGPGQLEELQMVFINLEANWFHGHLLLDLDREYGLS